MTAPTSPTSAPASAPTSPAGGIRSRFMVGVLVGVLVGAGAVGTVWGVSAGLERAAAIRQAEYRICLASRGVSGAITADNRAAAIAAAAECAQ